MRKHQLPVGALRRFVLVRQGAFRGSLALPLAALSALGCERSHAPPSPPQAVTVVSVATSEAAEAMRFSGHVEPATQVDLAFKVPGYVSRVATPSTTSEKPRPLQEGDDVVRGQELASLRRIDYEQQLAMATASREQAEASRRQAELDVDRSRALAASGTIPWAQLEADRNRLAGSTAASSEAAARVSQNVLALRDTSLRAPMAGTLVHRAVEPGTLVTPSTVAFTIADLSVVKVVFAIPDIRVPSVHLGTRYVVTVDALPGVEWDATVTRMSPVADPRSHVFEIRLDVQNPEHRLKPGMVAALRMPLEGPASAAPPRARAVIPLSAIVRSKSGRGFGVFVVDERNGTRTARAKDIVLGDYDGRAIAVEQGLSVGDTVIDQGAGLLSDGARVAVLP